MHLSAELNLQQLGATVQLNMAEQNDRDLLVRMLQQDKQAFAALYDRYAPRILGLARKMLVQQAAAEDATQETFLILWQKGHLYSAERGALLTWLYRVCRNVCLDRLKRPENRREVSMPPIVAQTGGQDTNLGAYDPAATQVRVNNALARLSHEDRDLLEQAFFRGMSHSQIANLKQLPLGTVKTRIAGALKRLRHEIGGTWKSGEDW